METVVGVVVASALSFISQFYLADRQSRHDCLVILGELDRQLQTLVKVHCESRSDPHKTLEQLQKVGRIIERLESTRLGLRIPCWQLDERLKESTRRLLGLSASSSPSDAVSHPNFVTVDICGIWGMGLRPLTASEEIDELRRLISSPWWHRLWSCAWYQPRTR